MLNDKEGRLLPRRKEVAEFRALETSRANQDVRSTVESQFRQMEQVHDRIRSEELAARLAEPTIH